MARGASATALATEDLAVVIAIDASGSMGVEPMAVARDAATGFVDAMPPAVRIRVMEFASEVILVSPLTNRFEVVYESEAFDQAEVEVTFQTDGTTLTGQRMVELPAAPVEEEPEPESEPEPETEPEPEEEPIAQPPPEPFEPTPWLQPG